MRTLKLYASRLDHLGACISGICLVHCIAMPLLLAFAPAVAHFIPGDELFHRLLALLVVGAGLPSFWLGFHKHGRTVVVAAGLAGLAIVLFALAFGDSFHSHIAEVALTMTGSVVLTSAHLANRTFCRKCSRCEH
ncbi:MAG TPA: MerC domain-containing protein [Candidatus Angelobacter sp.]|nr:MerC domain-containing protein [Candidatus Angelobacter sp.]